MSLDKDIAYDYIYLYYSFNLYAAIVFKEVINTFSEGIKISGIVVHDIRYINDIVIMNTAVFYDEQF